MRIFCMMCSLCGKHATVEVDDREYAQWMRESAAHRAMPSLAPGQRELLETGICQECSRAQGMSAPPESARAEGAESRDMEFYALSPRAVRGYVHAYIPEDLQAVMREHAIILAGGALRKRRLVSARSSATSRTPTPSTRRATRASSTLTFSRRLRRTRISRSS